MFLQKITDFIADIQYNQKMFGKIRNLLNLSSPRQSASHRRINDVLLDYWIALKGERLYPAESEIDPDDIHDIWDSCFLVRVDDMGRKDGYKYTYLGAALIEAYGDDYSGREVCDALVSPTTPALVKKLEEVRTGRVPVMVESVFTNAKGMEIKYRTCLLPLGTSPAAVEYVIGGMKWKAF